MPLGAACGTLPEPVAAAKRHRWYEASLWVTDKLRQANGAVWRSATILHSTTFDWPSPTMENDGIPKKNVRIQDGQNA
jgi:hypothetical protein